MVSKNIIVTLLVTTAAAAPETGAAQKAAYNTPGAGNPILPGYFAVPTIKKSGDTYYIYATTDGSGAGFGPAQLWCSKDFKNWTLMPDELAGQPLDMGTGCDEERSRRQVLLSLLPALQTSSGCGRYTSRSLEERIGRERSRTRTGQIREECHHPRWSDLPR